MNDFTASNGIAIRTKDGDLDFKRSDPFGWLGLCGGDVVDALREFFQAEADERLGRWRWPENPEYVVYAPRDFTHYVRVLDESGAVWDVVYREGVEDRGSLTAQAARAYFDAHPEPKPWHHAQSGEVWVLETRSDLGVDERAWHITDRPESFWSVGQGYLLVKSTCITAGRRIWPEVSS